ncbi:hypothetical protein [Coleofasciculus sp. H7-2]
MLWLGNAIAQCLCCGELGGRSRNTCVVVKNAIALNLCCGELGDRA